MCLTQLYIYYVYTRTVIHACRQQASCGMPLCHQHVQLFFTYICSVCACVYTCEHANAHESLRLPMNVFIDHSASYIIKAGSLLNPEFTTWACSRDALTPPPLPDDVGSGDLNCGLHAWGTNRRSSSQLHVQFVKVSVKK